jgi:uncharacterized protein involved in exopolysaccharide biosynthesis
VGGKIDSSLASQLGEDTVITLIQDGWSSVRNDPIIATSVRTASEALPLEKLDFLRKILFTFSVVFVGFLTGFLVDFFK